MVLSPNDLLPVPLNVLLRAMVNAAMRRVVGKRDIEATRADLFRLECEIKLIQEEFLQHKRAAVGACHRDIGTIRVECAERGVSCSHGSGAALVRQREIDCRRSIDDEQKIAGLRVSALRNQQRVAAAKIGRTVEQLMAKRVFK
jgi:hypothetical protein